MTLQYCCNWFKWPHKKFDSACKNFGSTWDYALSWSFNHGFNLNVKDEDGKPVDLNESIASSYKKYNLVRRSFNTKPTNQTNYIDNNGLLATERAASQQDLESPL